LTFSSLLRGSFLLCSWSLLKLRRSSDLPGLRYCGLDLPRPLYRLFARLLDLPLHFRSFLDSPRSSDLLDLLHYFVGFPLVAHHGRADEWALQGRLLL
jgi:hypothetical protein